MTNQAVCDYKGYDYKTAFWNDLDRDYEHKIEHALVHRLTREYSSKQGTLIDLGCGFGRLFDAYKDHATTFNLVDYSHDLLKEAKSTIKTSKPISFVQGNAYNLPFQFPAADTVVSIRTLHHFTDLPALFAEVHRVLKTNGVFIFEIPNKAHLLNRIRYKLKRLASDPQSKDPLVINPTYVNYHPLDVFEKAQAAGFDIVETIPVSFFRQSLIKRLFPTSLLVWAESQLQHVVKQTWLTPSIYVVVKRVDR